MRGIKDVVISIDRFSSIDMPGPETGLKLLVKFLLLLLALAFAILSMLSFAVQLQG